MNRNWTLLVYPLNFLLSERILMASKFITVSTEIMHDKNLTPNQKFILAEIEQLSQLDRGCIASNQHFSDLIGIARESASRSINDLEKKGYINIEIVPGTRNHVRSISLNNLLNPPKQNVKPPLTKCLETKENKQVNKTINTKKINKKESTNEDMVREYYESNNSLNLDAALEWIQFKGNSYKAVGIKKVCSFLCKYDFTTQSEIVDSSIMNNYKGLFEPKKTYNKPAANKKQSSDDFIDNFFGEPEIVEVQVM